MNNITTKSGIYLLRNKVNNKIYIGKAKNLRIRIGGHALSKKDYNRGKSLIKLAICKYGWENFTVEILETFDKISKHNILNIESKWIKKFDSTNKEIGYNLLKYSNDWTGYSHSEETKNKISDVRIKNGLAKGDKNPMFGKKHTEYTKNKISETKRKNPKNLGENHPFYGSRLSKEHVLKLIESSRRANQLKIRKQVKQIDIITGEVINIWCSATKAAVTLFNKKERACAISAVCKKKITKSGWLCKTAFGFKWEYLE